MAANPGNEQWYIKENGGSGESVGIASTGSKWFIAEEVLRDNAEMICRLFNEQAADTKVQNFNSHQRSNGAEPAEIPRCPFDGNCDVSTVRNGVIYCDRASGVCNGLF